MKTVLQLDKQNPDKNSIAHLTNGFHQRNQHYPHQCLINFAIYKVHAIIFNIFFVRNKFDCYKIETHKFAWAQTLLRS